MTAPLDGNTHETPAVKLLLGAGKTTRSGQHSIAQRLASMEQMLAAASSNPAIQELLAPHGFGPERIALEGQDLLAQVQQCIAEQAVANGKQFSAKDERDRVYREARSQFSHHRTLARLALRGDRGAAEQLGLQDRPTTAKANWLAQARRFYRVATGDPQLQMRLAELGLTLDKLEGGRGMVEHVAHCLHIQASTRDAARKATQQRDVALRRLDAWMAEFRTTARFALRDRPELRGTLGL